MQLLYFHSSFVDRGLLYLICSSLPFPHLIPHYSPQTTLKLKFLRFNILNASHIFGELQVCPSFLPINMGTFSITNTKNLLAFAIMASRHDTFKRLAYLLKAQALPPTSIAMNIAKGCERVKNPQCVHVACRECTGLCYPLIHAISVY